jgi:cobalt-zinc-cadmium efflux system membrane fusion protein
MTAAEREAQGIVTARIESRILADEIVVPGEVMADVYRSVQISPRIAAQVVARHVRLGHAVEKGDRLLTLSSVEMAKAQGELIVAERDWRRIRGLGRDIVSERRYVEAEVAAQQAYAKIQAFGMAPEQAAAFVKTGDPAKATGAFDLFAPQAGVVVKDEFLVGQFVEPGHVLLEIVDETLVGVEAKVTPEQLIKISAATTASIRINANESIEGKVIHFHHSVDPATRTIAIRIQVENTGDKLHPGQFVTAVIPVGENVSALAVPEAAVMLLEGKSVVFKLEGDEFHPIPVTTGANRGGLIEISQGLADGDEIVIEQAFKLKSMIMKSGIGEGH